MPKYTIITCISNHTIYDKCLLTSINQSRHNHDIEIIPITNSNNAYSASNSLNIGIKVAKSNNLIIAHQDIKLLGDWFTNLDNIIEQLPQDWAILGCAGISLQYGRQDIGKWGGTTNDDTIIIGKVWHDDSVLNQQPYWNGLDGPEKVHCIDECLFVINKKVGLRFDQTYTGFHFYGVDICMQARAAGYSVYAATLPIIHYGKYSASFIQDRRYWTYLRYLHNKWRLRFPEMLGTHMHWGKDELTSYIPMELESHNKDKIYIQSMGIKKARITSDRGYIKEDL